MSAGTPGKLQRALAGCCSLIKGSKRTFNFKGLFLKDSACCKVATIQNITILAGPNFAVSYSPAISGITEICTCATDRKLNFLCIKAEEAISIMDFLFFFFSSLCIFSLFNLFSSSFLEELEAVTFQAGNSTLQSHRCPTSYLLSLRYLCVLECTKCTTLAIWFDKIDVPLFLHKWFPKVKKKGESVQSGF